MDANEWLRIVQQKARTARARSVFAYNDEQRRGLFAFFRDFSREDRLGVVSDMIDRPISSFNDLLRDEAAVVLDELGTPEFWEYLNDSY